MRRPPRPAAIGLLSMEISLSVRNPAGVEERIPSVETSAGRPARPWQRRSGGEDRRLELGTLLDRVARGDQDAFEQVYRHVAGPVYGLALRVVRDPAQAEEVAQEVLVDVWRTAARYDETRGSALAWVMTLAHRRAVDRVRSAQAVADREERTARVERDHDEVAESVAARLEREQVRRCLGTLTELQRESVTLAYYSGYTYREVAELLQVPLGTVKTRMRDGLIRMRDCLGVGEQ
ncbi:MAG TPA: ECF RNA polymerase sigma factor SigK [Streptosporangiaceae bacterium]|nr:ECF RNA polymerase sigma factor SigK [Streptosporangiaceae bacterium]